MSSIRKYIVTGVLTLLAPMAFAINFTSGSGDYNGMTWTLDGVVTGRFAGAGVVVSQGTDIAQWSKASGIENVMIDRAIDIKVYPNPVVDNLHVKGAEYGAQWQIISIDGRTAATGALYEGIIDCSTLAQGTYIVTISDAATATMFSHIIIKK